MLFGGESKNIVLGELPSTNIEHEQDFAQDVVTQWIQENNREKIIDSQKKKLDRIDSSSSQKLFNCKHCKSSCTCLNRSSVMSNTENIDYYNSASQRMKKVIPVDFNFEFDDDNEDVAENTHPMFKKDTKNNPSSKDFPITKSNVGYNQERQNSIEATWDTTKRNKLTQSQEYNKLCDLRLEPYDLATQCTSQKISRKYLYDRLSEAHSSSTKNKSTNFPRVVTGEKENFSSAFSNLSGNHYKIDSNKCTNIDIELERKTSVKKQNCDSFYSNSNPKASASNEKSKHSSLESMFYDDKLSLTLEEIVHIRNVLTKAELESLPVEGRVKEDVQKRKVCFLCLKTRFGLFGPWGRCCRICERTVCIKCYSKIRIPADNFADIPVILLSRGSLLLPHFTNLDTKAYGRTYASNKYSTDSAPVSPAMKHYSPEVQHEFCKKMSHERLFVPSHIPNHSPETSQLNKWYGQRSDRGLSKMHNTNFGTSSRRYSDQEQDVDKYHGELMIICHDCRILLIQIIKSSRSTRANIRNDVISRLTLDLSPAYV